MGPTQTLLPKKKTLKATSTSLLMIYRSLASLWCLGSSKQEFLALRTRLPPPSFQLSAHFLDFLSTWTVLQLSHPRTWNCLLLSWTHKQQQNQPSVSRGETSAGRWSWWETTKPVDAESVVKIAENLGPRYVRCDFVHEVTNRSVYILTYQNLVSAAGEPPHMNLASKNGGQNGKLR